MRKKLHEILLQCSKSTRMRWAELVVRTRAMKIAYIILVRRPKGKRHLGTPQCNWKGNIKIYLKAIGCEDMEWN
jgi:hypothetical protein